MLLLVRFSDLSQGSPFPSPEGWDGFFPPTPMAKIENSVADGAKFYKMFVAGTLVYTDPTHKAWLDEYYNQLMNIPDLEIFERNYRTYLQTYHPYMMRTSYGQLESSI